MLTPFSDVVYLLLVKGSLLKFGCRDIGMPPQHGLNISSMESTHMMTQPAGDGSNITNQLIYSSGFATKNLSVRALNQ